MLKLNEGKVCEAILRHLEEREGVRRNEVISPELKSHAYPVELTWKLGTQLYALEHTGIEPFDGHMRFDAKAPHYFDPISSALADVLPKDTFEVHIPVKALLNSKKAEVVRVQTALVDWIRREAPALRPRGLADYGGDICWKNVPNVPFPVRLFRFENQAGLGGRVQIRHVVNSDSEQDRTKRLGRACDKKFPKLFWWKRNQDARTILVLEDNDIQLTNHEIVAKSYLPLALSREDRPDETYLVSTCLPVWSAWPLLIGDKTIDDLRVSGYALRWEIDPTWLGSATAR